MKKAIINKKVKHQGIGGKEIIIEKELSIGELLDLNLEKWTIGLFNFFKRRTKLFDEEYEDMKIYYGHVGNLGYFVADDEIEMIESD